MATVGRCSPVDAMLPAALSLLPALLAEVGAQAPPAPPDRLWFRQDSLGPGQTCAAQFENIKDTEAVISGKGPIILPEDATFSVCIKFLEGLYTDPSTGEAVKRAGRDWAYDTGSKGPCAEGCCEYQYRPRAGQYTKWTVTTSDCSAADPGLANEALLYLRAKEGEAKKVCILTGEEWKLVEGVTGGCVGPCCTVIQN